MLSRDPLSQYGFQCLRYLYEHHEGVVQTVDYIRYCCQYLDVQPYDNSMWYELSKQLVKLYIFNKHHVENESKQSQDMIDKGFESYRLQWWTRSRGHLHNVTVSIDIQNIIDEHFAQQQLEQNQTQDYHLQTVSQLQALLRLHGLMLTGKKNVLVKRLNQ